MAQGKNDQIIVTERSGGFERNSKAVRGAKLGGVVKHIIFTQHDFVIKLDCGMSGQIGSKEATSGVAGQSTL